MATKREIERQLRQENVLCELGFTPDETRQLRRISNTLQRWHELECGTGDGQVLRSVERDTDEGRPYMRVQYPTSSGYVDKRWPVADREKGAKKRLAAIMQRVNAPHRFPHHQLSTYIQTDPRGAALYILRPGDVPEGKEVMAYYSRGICVY